MYQTPSTPARVITAGVLQIIVGLLNIVGGVALLAMAPMLVAEIGAPAEVTTILLVVGGIGIGLGVFMLVISIFLFKLANWSRITTFIVQGILGVLGFLMFILGDILAIATTVAAAIIVMLLVHEQSKEAFAHAKLYKK